MDEAQKPVVYKFDDMSTSSEGSYAQSDKRKRARMCYALLFLIVIAALATITAGVVLLRNAQEQQRTEEQNRGTYTASETTAKPFLNTTESSHYYMKEIRDLDDYCEPSPEARRIKLFEYLEHTQQLYFKMNPHQELVQRGDEPQEVLNDIVRRFKPFVPTPKALKKVTDKINDLRKTFGIQLKDHDESELKPRETQIISEINAVLYQQMSVDYEAGFYEGGWMFGPGYFCSNRICHLQEEIKILTYYYKPRTVEDVEVIYNIFIQYNETFNQHIENLKMGIESGMIKSKSACKAGIQSFKDNNLDVLIGTSAPVVIQNILNKIFYSQLEAGVDKEWERLYGHPILKTLYIAFFHGFIKPARRYYSFLENEYERHCPPDFMVGGLVNLPVDIVYTEGNAFFDAKTTTKKLPLTGDELDGKKLYEKILKRFTMESVTPDEVFMEGAKQIEHFYPKLLAIAKNLTGSLSEEVAIKKMKIKLASPKQYHGGTLKFPDIESNTTAFERCQDEASAKEYCPVRWRSMGKWRKYLNRVMAMMHPLLNDAFYFTGDKVTVPNCPIEVRPHFNRNLNSMYYEPSDAECSRPSVFAVPFFWEKYGPKFQEWSIVGHEARPGHYFQIQGAVELFSSPCKDKRFYHDKGFFGGFVEGWASYAENPVLSDDVMLYENDQLQKLGMYKWQIWRAIRLVIDTGLHYKNKYTVKSARELFEKYALDDGSEFSRKEMIRYMSEPGQAVTYMMGRLEFIKARERVEQELKENFDVRDFHYQVLSLGPVPLEYLSKYIDRYLGCLKNPTKKYCEYVFTPLRTIPKGTYRMKHRIPPPTPTTTAQQPQQKKQGRFML